MPARAKTSMMPIAIVPEPMTPTDSIDRRESPAIEAAGVWASATTTGDWGAS